MNKLYLSDVMDGRRVITALAQRAARDCNMKVVVGGTTDPTKTIIAHFFSEEKNYTIEQCGIEDVTNLIVDILLKKVS